MLNAWQGNPARQISKDGMFSTITSLISSAIGRGVGKFARYVFLAYGSISLTNGNSIKFSKAFSKPLRIPPMPAKSVGGVVYLCQLYYSL